jgi:hypothetical protein
MTELGDLRRLERWSLGVVHPHDLARSIVQDRAPGRKRLGRRNPMQNVDLDSLRIDEAHDRAAAPRRSAASHNCFPSGSSGSCSSNRRAAGRSTCSLGTASARASRARTAVSISASSGPRSSRKRDADSRQTQGEAVRSRRPGRLPRRGRRSALSWTPS